MLNYLNFILTALLLLLVGCTSYTEEVSLDESQEELAAQFEEQELPGYLEAVRSGSSSETKHLPLEQRKKIAQEQGISESDARNFQRELRLLAEDLGFEERDLEFIDTPYFFVDGAGEVRDLETYKGLLSFIMKERVEYEKREAKINALYDKYQPQIEAAKGDTVESRRLFEQYEEERQAILSAEN